MPRFFCPATLTPGQPLELPAGAARHVQVLRLQPGDQITLFNNGPCWPGFADGQASRGEFQATIITMGRSQVQVRVDAHHAVERESLRQVVLAAGVPANERMDWLVEKAVELGVEAMAPLLTGRSVLRLAGERAEKKVAHWQSVAVAACEQCGGNRVPLVGPLRGLGPWLAGLPAPVATAQARLLLSLRPDAMPLHRWLQGPGAGAASAVFLSGPEGGLGRDEEDLAVAKGFVPVSLGPRVLRAETAALVALALLGGAPPVACDSQG